jgi:hypothetical protein
MNEGVFLGAFKGFIFNFAQLSLVLYPSVYFANKSGNDNKFFSFLATYTALDALFYPVDSLKNILYADTLGKYSMKYFMQTSRPLPTHLTSWDSTVVFSSNWRITFPSCPASTAPPRRIPRDRHGCRGLLLPSCTP